ncbi:Receptor-like protein kinase [Quillaja saponaria]|uniref:Receptor-like protein kinase n=1 Tax=Quillaja saponaria TaxID=32244 RepID=A0AAD7LX71_QUISA|nr:Receptor-like protein kinase [Quillaja saponaria]
MKAFANLVFPNTILNVLPEESLQVKGESMEHGIITSVTQGAMPGQIPISFPNLRQIESLDLSFDNLNGRIPPQLTQLRALAVFRVHTTIYQVQPLTADQFSTFQ